jgi:antitoxin component YwqK of YwqJK toxin-antitoxin module
MTIRVSFEELDLLGFDVGGTEIFSYQGQPFTGILETKTNGIIYCEEEYKNGYKEGLQTMYHFPSGNIRSQIFLRNNNFDGIFKTWDDNGVVTKEAHFQNGIEIA